MQHAQTILSINGTNLYLSSTGHGSETIVFSHGFLMDHSMFDGQVEALKEHFNCVRYDQRGHGQSGVPKFDYEFNTLVDDAIQLIESLNVGAVHFVGMSTGGFVGVRIAIKRPDLLKSLVLMDTSANAESEQALPKYRLLMNVIRYLGWWPVAKTVMGILFHPDFLNDATNKTLVQRWKSIITGHNKQGVLDFGNAIFGRDDVLEQTPTITTPTAIIVGEADKATPKQYAEAMAERIQGSHLYIIPKAGHTAAIEKPQAVADAIKDFYQQHQMI